MNSSKLKAQGSRSDATPGFEPEVLRSELVVRDLRKTYRAAAETVEVLRGVSFSVRAGEMVAIMGASGAGKTTLLHLIGGLETADGGSAILNGFDITAARGPDLARFRNRQIGFVFQFHRLLPDLTAIENTAMPLLIGRCNRRESLDRAAAVLDQIGLLHCARRAVTELSGGEQQRVAIARALVTEPRLVLADEPTGNLDAQLGDLCGEMLVSLCRAHGAAVVIATHNERLARMCDRRLKLLDGKLRGDQAPENG
jgi:lipoprotein-releasing system ATP-binding protein